MLLIGSKILCDDTSLSSGDFHIDRQASTADRRRTWFAIKKQLEI